MLRFLKYFYLAGLGILTAVVMKSSILWDITLRSPLKVNQRFGGTCHLHLQGRRIGQARNQYEAHRMQRNISLLWMDYTGVIELYSNFVSNPVKLLDINIKSMDVKWSEGERDIYIFRIIFLFLLTFTTVDFASKNCWATACWPI
jgi:hypothetical protein